MIQPWKQRSSKTIYQNPWWKYQLDEFELPNGVKGEYHYMETTGSVMIVGVDEQGQIFLIRQYVYLSKDPTLEFPCGGRKAQSVLPDEQREFGEETNQSAEHWEHIGFFCPNLGLVKERCDVFVAWKLTAADFVSDETEHIEVVPVSIEALEEKIRHQEIFDGMTLAAWTIAKPFVEKLIREKKYL